MPVGTYRAISWPMVQSGSSYPRIVDYMESVHQSVQDILMTPISSRRMRPGYGVNTLKFVFENNTVVLHAKIRQEIKRALSQNEPRVTVVGVDLKQERHFNEDVLVVDVIYELNQQYFRTVVQYSLP